MRVNLHLIELTEEQQKVLLKYNSAVYRDAFDSDEDYENYEKAMEAIFRPVGWKQVETEEVQRKVQDSKKVIINVVDG